MRMFTYWPLLAGLLPVGLIATSILTGAQRPSSHVHSQLLQEVEGTALIVNSRSRTVQLIDLNSLTTVAILPTGPLPRDIAVSPNGEKAAISNARSESWGIGDSVTILDLRAKQTTTVDLGVNRGPTTIIWTSDESILVACEEPGTIVRVNVRYGKVEQAFPTVPRVRTMALSPDGELLAYPVFADGKIVLLNQSTGEEVRSIDYLGSLDHLAFSTDGSRLYAVARLAQVVGVFDSQTWRLIGEIPMPSFPRRIEVTANGNALVSCPESAAVALVDTGSNSVLSRIQVDTSSRSDKLDLVHAPTGLTTLAGGRIALATINSLDCLRIVDLELGMVVKQISTGAGPWGVAFSPLVLRPPDATPGIRRKMG